MMEMPMLFQEKMLAGLDRQIRMAIGSPGNATDDASVISMCVAPWEIPGLFDLPTGDPSSVVDRYRLRAVCLGHYYASNPPDHDAWAADIEDSMSVPLFSPLDVWKAKQRHSNGDPGELPPPITCDTDRLLRNIRRGYKTPRYCVKALANNTHDWELLSAALTLEGSSVTRSLNELVAERSLWNTSAVLEGEAVGDYWDSYSQTSLASLRKILKVDPSGRDHCVATWVSPSLIEVIESSEDFRDRTSRPKWLLYKAVTVHKGQLPEGEHNRMLAEALNEDVFSIAYIALLKPAPAFAEYAEFTTTPRFLRQLF